jgi:ribosomal protein L3 glutamine methyltransferase
MSKQNIFENLHNIRDFIRWGASRFIEAGLFFGHGTTNAFEDAEFLVLDALHIDPPLDDVWLDSRLTLDEKEQVFAHFERRIQERVPSAYIAGRMWFAGMMFWVDERVLVPRSPIAELIHKRFSPWLTYEPQRILDLCAGSGCIGIACASVFTDAEVQLSDISFDALQVADQNVQFHHLSDRVFPIQSDLFENLQGQTFDLIVSNPPYVDQEDLADMPDEYHAEPSIGLASGKDGLDFTRRLLAEAANHLTEQGILVVEVGNSWVALQAAYPEMKFHWVKFENGGDGVFVITAQQLRKATTP